MATVGASTQKAMPWGAASDDGANALRRVSERFASGESIDRGFVYRSGSQ